MDRLAIFVLEVLYLWYSCRDGGQTWYVVSGSPSSDFSWSSTHSATCMHACVLCELSKIRVVARMYMATYPCATHEVALRRLRAAAGGGHFIGPACPNPSGVARRMSLHMWSVLRTYHVSTLCWQAIGDKGIQFKSQLSKFSCSCSLRCVLISYMLSWGKPQGVLSSDLISIVYNFTVESTKIWGL